jgi:aldehyde dehydrogenase (NAD+)
VQVDTDPYSGATLAEMVMANQGDLDEAYRAAAKAQISWAARLPAEHPPPITGATRTTRSR